MLADAAEEIFGYRPRPDQLRAARKILEGNDVFVVAATGAGKSLVFALVAIAARLLGLQRVVIVICPLKALQMDQVRRLNNPRGAQTVADRGTTAGGDCTATTSEDECGVAPGAADTGMDHAGATSNVRGRTEQVFVDGSRSGSERGSSSPESPSASKEGDSETSASATQTRKGPLCIPAVAINEDNSDVEVFKKLRRGEFSIVYAAPECLLRNNTFLQLFRDPVFRDMLSAILVDEAHVIYQWGKNFRQDYNNLQTIRVSAGSHIPWGAFTATAPTHIFEEVYTSLSMGQTRPFWGMDLGADRPNVELWVRRMEYSLRSFASLFALIPEPTNKPDDLPKTIFYFKSRKQARTACDLLRGLLPPHLKSCLYAFTAVYSEEYKSTVMEWFRTGKVRWLFCTDAAGMGCDVPDIVLVVVYGVQDFCDAMQKAGRAGRDPRIQGRLLWLVEDWVFDDPESAPTKKVQEKRDALDSATHEFIRRSQSDQCMREHMVNYLRPLPQLPGFPTREHVPEGLAAEEPLQAVTWEVVVKEHTEPRRPCCSALCCRREASNSIQSGQLCDMEREKIARLQASLERISHPALPVPDTPSRRDQPSSPKKQRVSKQEREVLYETLLEWRRSDWARIRSRNKMLSSDWVMTDETIARLVNAAHRVVNVPMVTEAVIDSCIAWTSPATVSASLADTLEEFRLAFMSRVEKPRKRQNVAQAVAPTKDRSPPRTPTRRGRHTGSGMLTARLGLGGEHDENDAV
ncbi:ATP-dependent DNA helicase RecQ-like protein [Phanerochaete sordida]|uniref:DNA 3'-5' helicase n=1 Tax=Phanerochaete sordida TaxID=48140 RepID=A0A9P3FZC3_9APHY|nr:ATP-dependent DNA helicase RecQ-like protein [Phanerochaete sordida]